MTSLVPPALPAGAWASAPQPELDLGEGRRLRLWREADVPAVMRAYALADIQRWHLKTMTEEEARSWVGSWSRRWHEETGAGWAVTQGRTVFGQFSLRTLDLAGGTASVSYWVLPEARGRGLAAAALRAVAAWAVGAGLQRLELAHSTVNTASCRVAGTAGFELEGTRRASVLHVDGWHDMHLHAAVSTVSAVGTVPATGTPPR